MGGGADDTAPPILVWLLQAVVSRVKQKEMGLCLQGPFRGRGSAHHGEAAWK